LRPAAANLLGLALFLFIPLVLYLLVAHPEPLGASLAAGVALMLGHRFLARPYLERVRERKCVWCNRFLAAGAARSEVALRAGENEVRFAACGGHEAPALRFLGWVDRLRLPLRLGIGLPLVAHLATLALAAAGRAAPVALATDAFRFLVGLTVSLAALGPWLGPLPGRTAPPPRSAFPPHNFSLLGIRSILWIFRLVGVWWLVASARGLLAALAGR
jgi:hypothetical protein